MTLRSFVCMYDEIVKLCLYKGIFTVIDDQRAHSVPSIRVYNQ